MRDETKCLHSGYTPKNGEPRVLPIVQSTTYVYDSAAEVAAIFDDPTRGLCYSRFGNPTVMAVEEKIADLEGGVGAMCTTSGQAASLLSILNICKAGDSIVSLPGSGAGGEPVQPHGENRSQREKHRPDRVGPDGGNGRGKTGRKHDVQDLHGGKLSGQDL